MAALEVSETSIFCRGKSARLWPR